MDLLDFKEMLFDRGKETGFSEMELYYEKDETFHCELFDGEVDEYNTSKVYGISFRGVYEGKMGTAFTEKLDEESINFLLDHAKENSIIVDDDEIEEIFIGSSRYAIDQFFAQELAEIPIPSMVQLLKDIETFAKEEDTRVIGFDTLSLSNTETERALYNTVGVDRKEKHNYLDLTLSVIIQEGDTIKNAEMTKYTKDFSTLHPRKLAKEAVKEAINQLGQIGIESRSYPVLLRRDAASSLLHIFSSVFSGEKALNGHSLLKEQLGKEVATSIVTIVDDPLLPDGICSRTFDHEGVATKRLELVREGVLCTLLYNQKTAKKAGVPSTGHGYRDSYKGLLTVAPTNLFILPTSTTFEDMLSQVEEGVLITELAGLHSGANKVSGDFSFAANGFYIKEGTIQAPVNQMTIAGNFYELLKRVSRIGNDLELGLSYSEAGFIGSPSLLIPSMDVTVE